ncbi:MAG: methylated-DNA--[protein]-cysteine S-methyltransferase [Dehalococcoidia bacterium]|nr:methylated-DNA--[protein]-cysteine S-methyltransferase [Dehalococcoidia bacterium]
MTSPSGRFYLVETKLGWIGLVLSPNGPAGVRLRAITLPRAGRDDALREVVELGALEPASEAEAGDIARRVKALAEGQPADLAGVIDWDSLSANGRSVTGFRRAVMEEALRIPRGETRTYGWLAERVGRPRAARAVGRVMATNPLPIVIPCHRVIGSDGSLRGYGAGLWMKEALLRAEGARG